MDLVLLNIVGPKMITHVQAVATVLALIPIVGIAVFGWFWFRGETYMAAWNVSGLGTFGAIQSTLNVTLWSFIGVESASVAAGVVKNPKRNVPYRHHWWGIDCRRLLCTFYHRDYGDDP